MSFFGKLTDGLKINLVIHYAKQPSTWKGIISWAVSAGLVSLSPEVQDSIVATGMQLVAAGAALKGTIDVFRNEKKLPWQQ